MANPPEPLSEEQPPAVPRPAKPAAGRSEAELSAAEVGEVLSALVKALRAHQMYQSNNPVYQKFVGAAQQQFTSLWDRASALHLTVEESGLRWGDHVFSTGDARETLAFQFYKDGIRMISFLPGFEEEVDTFLEIVHQARASRDDADDLITLLWERDFSAFQYSFVDLLADGVQLPEASEHGFMPIAREQLAQDATEPGARPAAPPQQQAQESAQTVVPAITREDFEETLYFLDESELHQLQLEVEREWSRDVKRDVLNALFDRLADPVPERQLEVLRALRQLLAASLGQGDLRSAATILRELDAISSQPGVLGNAQKNLVSRLFEELGDPDVLGQMIHLLESGEIDPRGDDLSLFFRHLRPTALPILIRGAETSGIPGVRERLQDAIDQLARDNSQILIDMLGSSDEVLARGAASLIGRLKIASAAAHLGKLLTRTDPSVRLAAVEAIVASPSGAAMEALMQALEDSDREVRISAARGLGAIRYRPARPRLEAALQSKILKDADTTEKITFFEAFGLVGGAEAVPVLDKILNGRGLLGRRPAPETRACAALGLGKVGTPAARNALQQASSETDPVIRNAIGRALRQEVAS